MEEPDHTPKPLAYYRSILAKGNGTQWRSLVRLCRENYEVSFQVGRALSTMDDDKFKTVKTLWKHAVEYYQPGINVKLGKEVDEDTRMRKLKTQKYSD